MARKLQFMSACKTFLGRHRGYLSVGSPKSKLQDRIETDLEEMGWERGGCLRTDTFQ